MRRHGWFGYAVNDDLPPEGVVGRIPQERPVSFLNLAKRLAWGVLCAFGAIVIVLTLLWLRMETL